jgi:preprotein translocase subunit SecF
MKNLVKLYDEYHKKILIIPAGILLLSLIYLTFFYIQVGDIIDKDISLTGGVSITFETAMPQEQFENAISQKFQNFEVKQISDNTGNQIKLVITTTEENNEKLKVIIEEQLDHKLTSENSSIEMTSSSLSDDFYKQLLIAIILAFFWMSAVIFLIFSHGKKNKFYIITLNIFLGFFLGKIFFVINQTLAMLIFIAFVTTVIAIYIKNSIPSFAIILAAFTNIIMTLSVVNLIGIKISTAGIIAFLMLIGYSVDTDILLTTRLLRGTKKTNEALFSAFKTGIMMTSTSLVAIITALIVIYPFGSILNQVFTILIIGLSFDILNTWITNASIIKMYLEKK